MAIGRINATLSGVQPGGLAKIVPTSVAVGSGTGSSDANGTVTFSGASSVSINGCFNSTYKNYRIVYTAAINTGFVTLRFRMRASGTDNTASNYFFGLSYANSNGNGGVLTNSTGTTSAYLSELYDRNTIVVIEMSNPFATDYTNYWANSTALASNTVASGSHFGGGGLTVTTSYDGITLFPSSNNMAGTITIYGYN